MSEVLLPGLLGGVVLPRIFLQRFELVTFSAVGVNISIKELGCLFPHIEHVLRWQPGMMERDAVQPRGHCS